jgi:hypothetical protein
MRRVRLILSSYSTVDLLGSSIFGSSCERMSYGKRNIRSLRYPACCVADSPFKPVKPILSSSRRIEQHHYHVLSQHHLCFSHRLGLEPSIRTGGANNCGWLHHAFANGSVRRYVRQQTGAEKKYSAQDKGSRRWLLGWTRRSYHHSG